MIYEDSIYGSIKLLAEVLPDVAQFSGKSSTSTLEVEFSLIRYWYFTRSHFINLCSLSLADRLMNIYAWSPMAWEGGHVRLVLTLKDSKGLTKELVCKYQLRLVVDVF